MVTVVGAAEFAFGGGVVSSAAEAITGPDASAEDSGDDASLDARRHPIRPLRIFKQWLGM